MSAPIDVTPEREARLDEWVQSYTLGVRDRWVASGEDIQSPRGVEALTLIAASMYVPERPEWMSLEAAQSVLASVALSSHFPEGHPWRSETDPLDLRDALRTVKSATADELAAGIGARLGVSVEQASGIVDTHIAEDVRGTGRTALYRHHDSDDTLLYVGIASDPQERARQHQRRSPWHPLSSRMTVEWFESRDAAHEAERDAIANERPVFNVAHTGSRGQKSAVEYLLARLAAQSEAVA